MYKRIPKLETELSYTERLMNKWKPVSKEEKDVIGNVKDVQKNP